MLYKAVNNEVALPTHILQTADHRFCPQIQTFASQKISTRTLILQQNSKGLEHFESGTMFNFIVLDQKKIQNLMKKGGTEKFKKKPIKFIFGKVNEGDEINKKFDLFERRFVRAKEKTSNNNIVGKMFFIS